MMYTLIKIIMRDVLSTSILEEKGISFFMFGELQQLKKLFKPFNKSEWKKYTEILFNLSAINSEEFISSIRYLKFEMLIITKINIKK